MLLPSNKLFRNHRAFCATPARKLRPSSREVTPSMRQLGPQRLFGVVRARVYEVSAKRDLGFRRGLYRVQGFLEGSIVQTRVALTAVMAQGSISNGGEASLV